jgi:hypothetical protein
MRDTEEVRKLKLEAQRLRLGLEKVRRHLYEDHAMRAYELACRTLDDKQRVVERAEADRAMLVKILADLDSQYQDCPRCGHEDPCKDMDVAIELRSYLDKNPA